MTTLGDILAGEAFVIIARVTGRGPAGITASLFTASATPAGQFTIAAADGTITGQITAVPPASTPVTKVTRWTVVAVGDILQRDQTGETMVARAVDVAADGTFVWYASTARRAGYTVEGWTRIGHTDLT